MTNVERATERRQPRTSERSSAKLQILATEHWSLLATRSLTYGESFSRVGMFFTVLTGAVVSLALMAQVEHFNRVFTEIALLILSVVFLSGLATLGRLWALNREDILWVAGMNRLRRAYLELEPELEQYFLTDSHDDMRGILASMGIAGTRGPQLLPRFTHGFTTMPAMLGLIVVVVAGVVAALIAASFGASETITIIVGAVTFLMAAGLAGVLQRRSFVTLAGALPARFPSKSIGATTS